MAYFQYESADQMGRKEPFKARSIGLILSALVLMVLLFCVFVKVNAVTTAKGRIFAGSDPVPVKTGSAGEISVIHVVENQRVSTRDPLVAVNVIGVSSRRGALTAELDNLQADLMGINGALTVLERWPEPVDIEALPSAGKSHAQEVTSRLKTMLLGLQTLEDRRLILERLTNLQDSVNQKAEQRLALIKSLEQTSLYPKAEYLLEELELLDRESQLETLRLEKDENANRIQKAKAEVEEYLLTGISSNESNRRLLRTRISEVQSELEELEDSLAFQVTTAPIDGFVHGLIPLNAGSYVESGTQLLNIVPDSDSRIIKSRLRTRDAGFIKPGQHVDVSIDAYPFEQFGTIPGQIQTIRSDSLFDEAEKDWFFEVDVVLLESHIATGDVELPIKVGMTGRANFVVRKRRIISLILDPILKHTVNTVQRIN